MKKVLATTAALVLTLTMTGCVAFALDDLAPGQPAATAESTPAESTPAEATPMESSPSETGSPAAAESSDSDAAQDAAFRELVSSVPSEILKSKVAQDYGIDVAKSLCAQLDAGVPAHETVDDVPGSIELTDDELFTVIGAGIITYCPQHEDVLGFD